MREHRLQGICTSEETHVPPRHSMRNTARDTNYFVSLRSCVRVFVATRLVTPTRFATQGEKLCQIRCSANTICHTDMICHLGVTNRAKRYTRDTIFAGTTTISPSFCCLFLHWLFLRHCLSEVFQTFRDYIYRKLPSASILASDWQKVTD